MDVVCSELSPSTVLTVDWIWELASDPVAVIVSETVVPGVTWPRADVRDVDNPDIPEFTSLVI